MILSNFEKLKILITYLSSMKTEHRKPRLGIFKVPKYCFWGSGKFPSVRFVLYMLEA